MLLARIRPGRKGWIAFGLLLAAMLALWAWQPWAGPRTGVVRLAEHPLTHTVVATGYVSNTEESVLGATLTARVASTPVEEGQSVRAGDVLIRLESAEAAAAVEQARGNARQADATLAEARRQFRRQQHMRAAASGLGSALDDAFDVARQVTDGGVELGNGESQHGRLTWPEPGSGRRLP